MTEEELDTWGLLFLEENEYSSQYSTEGLTDQQKEWLEEFFSEV